MPVEAAGSPRFPGHPECPLAVLLDPGRTGRARPLRHADVATAWDYDEGSRERRFRARSQSLGTGCLRFAVRITPPHARLASGCLAEPGRAGFVDPQGDDERSPSSSLFLLSRAFLAQ
jgi:hypothetical protein